MQIELLKKIQGPMVLIANHPFGAVDSLMIFVILASIREDFKLIGNQFLEFIPEIRNFLIPVHVMGIKKHPQFNIRPMRQILKYLKNGDILSKLPDR